LNHEIRYPSVKQVERLCNQIIAMSGGERGYLSKSNLEYLLDTVKDVGERLHRKQALSKKAAFLLYNVIVLHPFVNGNKRTGYELVKLFLRLNGHEIDANPREVYQFLLDVASGKVSASDVDRWVTMNLTELNEE
jgi:death-on-curing protein